MAFLRKIFTILRTNVGHVGSGRVCLWFCCQLFLTLDCRASAPEGTWKYERAVDYYGRAGGDAAPEFRTVILHNGQAKFSDACVARVSEEDYFFSDVFQPMSKDGVTEMQLAKFLQKNAMPLLGESKKVFTLRSTPAYCSHAINFFHMKDKIVVISGATFYIYNASGVESGVTATPAQSVAYANYKLTRLPYNDEHYYGNCAPKILDAKGRPRTTEKCAPEFYPYVADAKAGDSLMNIIGNHNFARGGATFADAYATAFKFGTRATFLVFPPMKNVWLVRVDDFDVVKEQRDTMSPTYLSIVDGKVVDQIQYCDFDAKYVCMAEGKKVAKLQDDGKFQRFQ